MPHIRRPKTPTSPAGSSGRLAATPKDAPQSTPRAHVRADRYTQLASQTMGQPDVTDFWSQTSTAQAFGSHALLDPVLRAPQYLSPTPLALATPDAQAFMRERRTPFPTALPHGAANSDLAMFYGVIGQPAASQATGAVSPDRWNKAKHWTNTLFDIDAHLLQELPTLAPTREPMTSSNTQQPPPIAMPDLTLAGDTHQAGDFGLEFFFAPQILETQAWADFFLAPHLHMPPDQPTSLSTDVQTIVPASAHAQAGHADDSGAALRRPRALQFVDPATGQSVPANTPGAIPKATYVGRQKVDPQTGVVVPANTPGAISRAAYAKRQKVDPQTGIAVPADTPGAISSAAYIKRQKVDPQTGLFVAADTPGAISRNQFSRRRLVHPQTGAPVAAGTAGAISRDAFHKRKRDRVDAATGSHVAADTPDAISGSAYHHRRRSNAQTSSPQNATAQGLLDQQLNDETQGDAPATSLVSQGTPRAIPRSHQYRLRPVDPTTGEAVPADAPDAIPHRLWYARRPVDPTTGEAVPADAPGAIPHRLWYARRPVDPTTGTPVPPGTPGAIFQTTFRMRELVDPETGKRVATGTPGGISRNAYYLRQTVDPDTGKPVAKGTPGAISRSAFHKKPRRDRL